MKNVKHNYPGLLIVIEGTDGSGRSTQIEMLRKWTTLQSYGTLVSKWKTSQLLATAIDQAKERNLLNASTFSLIYAADFTDRLENNVIPSLKAGMIVLMDRYTYTAYARDVVRGVKPKWVRKLYEYAPKPDLIFYLDMPVDILLKRIIATTGFDFYESGRDVGLSTDFYESFQIYQKKILAEFDKMKGENDFITIDGTLPPKEIHSKIKDTVSKLLEEGKLA